MFPKNRINIIYRFLSLICYIVTIYIINSNRTLLLLLLVYCFFALSEKSFRNIELIIATISILWISHLLNSYLLLKIMLVIDYSLYFLDSSYNIQENEKSVFNEHDYIRFKKNNKKKKKGSNNITTAYILVHLIVLFLIIMVG